MKNSFKTSCKWAVCLFVCLCCGGALLAQTKKPATKPATTSKPATGTAKKPVTKTTTPPKTTAKPAAAPVPPLPIQTAPEKTAVVEPVKTAVAPEPIATPTTEATKESTKPSKTKKVAEKKTKSTPAPKIRKTNSSSRKGFYVGLRADALYTTFSDNDLGLGGDAKQQFAPSFGGGISLRGQFSNAFAIQTEALFSQWSYKYTGTDNGLAATLKLTTNQLQVPLLLVFSMGKKMPISIELGGVGNYTMGSSIAIDNNVEKLDMADATFKDRFTYGAVAGVGVVIPVGRSEFTVSGRGQYVLGDLNEVYKSTYAKPLNYGLSVGYHFKF